MPNALCLSTILVIGLSVAACQAPPTTEEQRVAELEKQLAAAKQDLAAKTAEAGAAATGAVQTAAEAQAAATAATEQANRDRAATEQALADQQKALADQQAEAARQADESARLRREMEEMKPREYTLPAGTVIPVRTTSEISTTVVKDGSVFNAVLEKPIVVDGTTLAKTGARVTCIVVSSDPGGRVKGVASMVVAAQSIAGVGGNTLNLKTDSYDVEAGSTKGRDAKRTGIAAGAGAVIGAIAGGGKGAAIGAGVGAAGGVGANMATRGQPAVIPSETLIDFTLTAPTTVVFRK